MEITERAPNLEVKTREFCVCILGDGSRRGSGVLYYDGEGDTFYVFTCAHVLDGLDEIELHLLRPVDALHDSYEEYVRTVSKEQIAYSPLDEVETDENETPCHTQDVAVISVPVEPQAPMWRTDYCLATSRRNETLYAQGFPGRDMGNETLLEKLDMMTGRTLSYLPKVSTFQLRVEDRFIDHSDREYELEGFSGAPLWRFADGQIALSGLLTSGVGSNAYRGKVIITKSEIVHSVMKSHFDVALEMAVAGIPAADVADGGAGSYTSHQQAIPGEWAGWLAGQNKKLRMYIDALQMQKAIDIGRETISDARFGGESAAERKTTMQLLLYCYEICRMDDEFAELENNMNALGLAQGHDSMRWLTFLFSRGRYEEALAYAEGMTENDTAYEVSALFKYLCRAYMGAGTGETVRHLVDERERLTVPVSSAEEESFFYQMIGYVYGNCYKQYDKAVRCLNRAYRIDYNGVVLESLATAYYFLAVGPATGPDGIAKFDRIDRESLYKARELFLALIEKADDLFLTGTMQRMGMAVYNTFWFSCDNYRSLILYPKLRPYLQQQGRELLQDLERKHASVLCQSGSIDFGVFSALTEEDKEYYSIKAEMIRCGQLIQSMGPDAPDDAMNGELCTAAERAERFLQGAQGDKWLDLRVDLINLYAWGTRLLGWDALDHVRRHYKYVMEADGQKQKQFMTNFLFELEHTYEEAVPVFEQTFREDQDMQSWMELVKLHIRHGRFDRADDMYKELITEHKELYADEPEYVYRAYMDYITIYRRDLKEAIRCYLENKDKFHDASAALFWEMELMKCSNSVNDPELFEVEYLDLREKGILSEKQYCHEVMTAYLLNLVADKAMEYCKARDALARGTELTDQEMYLLMWQRKISIVISPFSKAMFMAEIMKMQDRYNTEDWCADVQSILSGRFRIERKLCVDMWALYFLFANGEMQLLADLDEVYVTHNTVSRLLTDTTSQRNPVALEMLDWLESTESVHIQSADFAHQLEVRDRAPYDEVASSIALADQLGCPALIGQQTVHPALKAAFAKYIIRPSDLKKIAEQL